MKTTMAENLVAVYRYGNDLSHLLNTCLLISIKIDKAKEVFKNKVYFHFEDKSQILVDLENCLVYHSNGGEGAWHE